jgi:hypothetical protein
LRYDQQRDATDPPIADGLWMHPLACRVGSYGRVRQSVYERMVLVPMAKVIQAYKFAQFRLFLTSRPSAASVRDTLQLTLDVRSA